MSVASLSLYKPGNWSNCKSNYNHMFQSYGPCMNESNIFQMWYDTNGEVDRTEVSVLEDVIRKWVMCTNNVTCLLMKLFNY